MKRADEFTYRVMWLGEEKAFVGTVAEFPSLSDIEDTQNEAFTGIVQLVADVLSDAEQDDEGARIPLGELDAMPGVEFE